MDVAQEVVSVVRSVRSVKSVKERNWGIWCRPWQ